MKKRTIRIGIDGAPFTMLERLTDDGVMPFLKQLRNEGTFRQMDAPIPDNSAVSWSSIMTGTNPGEHGIFGFTDLIPGTYTMRFPNFRNLRAKSFWQREPDRRHVVINLPFSYPADPGINGRMVSGFVAPNLEQAARPAAFLAGLKERNYRVDPDTRKIYQSRGLFYDDMMAVHAVRVQLMEEQFQLDDWDTFMIVFTGSDRIGHYLFDAWEKADDPFHERFLDYFRDVDTRLRWLFERIGPDDRVVMMSDHGMERVQREVNLNYLLQEHGFLMLDSGGRNYNAIADATRAFALEPSRIHLNYAGTYPKGCVPRNDAEPLLQELTVLFSSISVDGEPVIRRVCRKEELYSGPCLANAPDLLLVPNTGFSLRGTLARQELFTAPETLVGMHRGSDAFLYVHGREHTEAVPDRPATEDIQGIIEKII